MFSEKQRGISTVNILLGMILVISVGTLLTKLGPMYTEFWSVKSSIANVSESSTLSKMTNSDVRNRLNKTFGINGVELDARDFRINRNSSNEVIVSHEYERRAKVFQNIDVVVRFTIGEGDD